MIDSSTDLLVQITAAVFQSGNKGRFSDGDHTFWAGIENQTFLDRIDAGEAFAKGDMLRGTIRTLQWRDVQGSLHAEKSITRVMEHLHPSDIATPLFTMLEESAGGAA